MTYENELPLPDYDGGPLDQMRDAARKAQEDLATQEAIERINTLAHLRVVLSYVVSDDAEVRSAAELLYGAGYRKVK